MKFIELTCVDGKKTMINPKYVIGIVPSEHSKVVTESAYNPIKRKREAWDKRIVQPCTRIFLVRQDVPVTEDYEEVKALLEGAEE